MGHSFTFLSQSILPEEEKERCLPEQGRCTGCKATRAPPIMCLSYSLHLKPTGQGSQQKSFMTRWHQLRLSNNLPLTSSSRFHKLNICHESLGWESWAGLIFSPAFISGWNMLLILDVYWLTLRWHTHRDLPTGLEIIARWCSEHQIQFQILFHWQFFSAESRSLFWGDRKKRRYKN